MANSSNSSDAQAIIQHLEYLYASNTNVSNFVSVKLSGDRNYQLWKTQMMCLMDTHQMLGLVEEGPIDSIMKKYDTLLKGWIFGSVSEDVLRIVVDPKYSTSAKDVWDRLKSYFDATSCSHQQVDSAPTKVDTKTEMANKKAIVGETIDEGQNAVKSEAKGEEDTQTETKDSAPTKADTITETNDKNIVLEDTITNDKGVNSAESEAKGDEAAIIETNVDSAPTKVDTKTEMANKKAIVGETIDEGQNAVKSEAKGEEDTQTETKDSAPTKADTIIETNDKNIVLEDTVTNDKGVNSAKSEAKGDDAALIETNDSAPTKVDKKHGELLQKAIEDQDWDEVSFLIKSVAQNLYILNREMNSDGNTVLHMAVGIGRNDVIITALLNIVGRHDLTGIKNFDGSTLLHIAAIVGNTIAARLLIMYQSILLDIRDKNNKTPLDKAYENMHLDTIEYLLEATDQHLEKKKAEEADKKSKTNAKGVQKGKEAVDGDGKNTESVHRKTKEELDDNGKGKEAADDQDQKGKEAAIVSDDSHRPHVQIGANLLVNAISAKLYKFASRLLKKNYEYAVTNDKALMAIARTFPSGLDYWEKLFYPSLDNMCERIVRRTKWLFSSFVHVSLSVKENMHSVIRGENKIEGGLALILGVPLAMVYWIYHMIIILLLMVYFPIFMLYFLFWKVAMRVVPHIRNIEQKKKEYKVAKEVLDLVCQKIKALPVDRHHSLYNGPILEAACQNAYEVVVEILKKWPEAIRCKDENDYDIIQLAIMHRSEKVYNLINVIGERKSIYRTMMDSSENNMLHLAGRLPPSNKLKLRTGAALQLQRELQWREEVKDLVFPAYATKENIFKDTPDMVFTEEHENLVKEGEKWIKTVAESCSITAALITTIMFAAAITVPGGSTQEGDPVLMKEVAFTIFAVADAISLFSSATALLVFLSILTARFAEQDFLIRLPRRLIIGLCTLLLSTTSMMVAFCATLFLVFCRDKLWTLAPLCGLAFLPIAIFFILQFPLIPDLFRSTYISKFGKSNHNISKFNPNYMQFFGK